jgi:hypothetical protein
MSLLAAILGAALIAASHAGPAADEVVEANGTCYDAAFVGRIIDTNDFEDLNEVLPRNDESLWWGGVSSVLLRREKQLVGHSLRLGWARAIISAQPLRTTKLLLFTRNHASGVPIVVYWTVLRKAPAREISEAQVKRCS